MYRPETKPRDRLGTIAVVLLIHAGLALALLNLSGTIDLSAPQPSLQTFDVDDPEPPPPPPVIEEETPKPKDEEGAASAPNIKSRATPVAAPEPRIVVPTPNPMPATPTPNTGSDSTQGAAPVAGPGTGAGGSGTGTGSGGSGSGTGGGGTGTAVRPVRQTGNIYNRDYPRGMVPTGPVERVFVNFYVDSDGRVRECNVDRSSGNRALDLYTCQLIVRRFRYRPALDRQGRPVRHKNFYIQDWLQRGVRPPPLPGNVIVTEPTRPG